MDSHVLAGSALSGQSAETLVDRFRGVFLAQPDARIYRFLVDGEGEPVSLTNSELDQRARAIAAGLAKRLAVGDRALIICPPGLDYVAAFLACLYAGVIAVPVYPPNPALLKRTLPRLVRVIADAEPAVVLAPASLATMADQIVAYAPALSELAWQAVDEIDPAAAPAWARPAIGPDDIAFLQYTSGSTGTPKGVMVSHASLLHNLSAIHQSFVRDDPDPHGMIWLPPYHDMGLIGGLLQPAYGAFPVTFMSPLAFLKRPIRWLRAISEHQATISGAPNFAYELCLRKTTESERAQLDLSSWRLAFSGAEPVRARTIDNFAETFARYGFCRRAFYPCYGLAEATLLVSGGERGSEPVIREIAADALARHRAVDGSADGGTRRSVGCGRAIPGQEVIIVDPERLVRRPAGQIGEIWVSGPSVASGYWRQAEETAQVFAARLADTGDGPFLRTGDLGFLDQGELHVTGRRKDMIIVAGRNHYPHDIEQSVEQCDPALRPGCGVACAIPVDDEEQLAVIQEVTGDASQLDPDRIFAAIRAAVAEEHELPVHHIQLVRPGTVPKTSSGKLQRSACRRALLAGELAPVASWSCAATGPETAVASASPVDAASPASTRPAGELEHQLRQALASQLGLPVDQVDPRAPFASFGLRSVDMVGLVGELERWLGRSLPATLLWEYPTIETLASYLSSADSGSPAAVPTPGERSTEPVAIIGIGCRFPGGADSPATYWRLLCEGRDAVTEVPADRWEAADFLTDDPAVPGKAVTRWGGFLTDIDQFDPCFFGISAREAARMDPQQRILAEVAWEALEDAGVVAEELSGSATGVFIGIATNDYGHAQFHDFARIDAYTGIGNAFSIAANRLSYLFDLKGPSLAIDTACSSSLVAVYQACASLAQGDCSLALAGGVNLILSPALAINFSKAGAMAPDGRCKAFDARANGYVRSEGAGVVVLKPLSRALADGDFIYGVIRGGAVNQDGRTNGLMAPNPHSQEAVLRSAYARAGVRPEQVHYIEAHGTGTLLGDPIEAKALATVVSAGRDATHPCLVGSVKSNLGHLEAAAGIAGFVKTALMLRHGMIPASLHYQQPNPHIAFEELRLKVADSLQPWPAREGPALAGVSSFGFGGTNAHLVLQEAPPVAAAPAEPATAAGRQCLLPISARSAPALRELAAGYQQRLAAPDDELTPAQLGAAAGQRRVHHEYRLACVGSSLAEFRDSLAAFAEGRPHPGLATGERRIGRRPKVAFLFAGQGPRWWPVSEELLAEPVFRQTLERCDDRLRQHVDWSLLEQMTVDPDRSALTDPGVCQPAFCALQLGLAALWRSWGIRPDTVVGHSVGEIAAAYESGALDLADALLVALHRGQLIRATIGQGKMAVAALSYPQAQQVLAERGISSVSVAASNGPNTTVFSGDVATLYELAKALDAAGVFCRVLESVEFASHSPQMEPLRHQLSQSLAGLRPRPATVSMCSTVTGADIDGAALDGDYWATNLRQPVLFDRAITGLVDAGVDTFIEISPHPMLGDAVTERMELQQRRGAMVASLRRDEPPRTALLGSVSELYCAGFPVDWRAVNGAAATMVSLPSYPWQRQRCWLDDEFGHRQRSSQDGHPALATFLRSAVEPRAYHWCSQIDHQSFPYLRDHQVSEAVVLPASFVLDAASAAAGEALDEPAVLENVQFTSMTMVPEQAEKSTVQLVFFPETDDAGSFQLFTRDGTGSAGADWRQVARGRFRQPGRDPDLPGVDSLADARGRCDKSLPPAEHYARMRRSGVQYGPAFQGIDQMWQGEREAVVRLRALTELTPDYDPYRIHPVLLDNCLQALAVALAADHTTTGPYLPVEVDGFTLIGGTVVPRWAHAVLDSAPDDPDHDPITGSVTIFDAEGGRLGEVTGITLRQLATAPADPIGDALMRLRWHELTEPDQSPPAPAADGWWLVLSDQGGTGDLLCARLRSRGNTLVTVTPGNRYQRSGSTSAELDPQRPEDFVTLLAELHDQLGPRCAGVVHAWGLDSSTPEAALTGPAGPVEVGVLHLVQALATDQLHDPPQLVLVTRGAQRVGEEPTLPMVAQAPLWGLARVIALEHHELHPKIIDLDPARPEPEVEADHLLAEMLRPVGGGELAYRAGRWFQPALEPAQLAAAPVRPPEQRPFQPDIDQNHRLVVSRPGMLESLTTTRCDRVRPGPGQVEVEVVAAGLNFSDVLKAMGLYPGLPPGEVALGVECAGRVSAVGTGVERFRVGDEVMAVAPASIAAFTITAEHLVVHRPARLSTEAASAIPIAFLTAVHSLLRLARLTAGERVLIHSAAGGVGLAALQVARQAGAEVLATAGTEEKRELLRGLGVTHVMDSRSLSFADEVMAATAGRGVDVVLNSLAGEALTRSLSVLAPHGRFVEIGKQDIYRNSHLGLELLKHNRAFFAVDMERCFAEQPGLVAELFAAVRHGFETGEYIALPIREFAVAAAPDAIATMAQGRHVGKIVLRRDGSEPVSVPFRPVVADATYLITGGCGALGLEVANYLVDQGARQLALLGRRPPSPAAESALARLRSAGATVQVLTGDVCRYDDVAAALDEIDRCQPPLRGVVHAAGLLDDGLLVQLDQQRMRSVTAPKIAGGWHLHRATQDRQLDFFVLFSSAASLLGSPSQGNYSAGNAFLDALAHYRQALGLPALSINWGPWSEIGLAARPDRGGELSHRGVLSLRPEEGIAALHQLLPTGQAQVAVLPLDRDKLRHAAAAGLLPQLLHNFLPGEPGAEAGPSEPSGEIRRQLLAVEPGRRRRDLLVQHCRVEIGRVLKLEPERIDITAPLAGMGFDSMLSLELRKRLETTLGIELPATLAWRFPTVEAVVPFLAERMGVPLDALDVQPQPDAASESDQDTSFELAELSDETVEALLLERLERIEGGP